MLCWRHVTSASTSAAIPRSDRVEEWLASFTEEMKATLGNLLTSYLAALTRAGEADFEAYPSQILCIGELVRFADSVKTCVDVTS